MTGKLSNNSPSLDAVLLTSVKLVTTMLGLLVTRLLSQHLSTQEYGTYSQLLMVSTTATSVTILGMVDGVNYFSSRAGDQQKRENYISTIFALQCLIGIATGAVVMLFRGKIAAGFDNPKIEEMMVFVALLPLLQNMLSMFQILMVSVGKAGWIAARNLVISVLRLLVVLLMVWQFHNVAVILAATVLMDAAQIVLFLHSLGKSGCRLSAGKISLRLSREIMHYCIPMGIFLLLNTLNRDCDRYLIAFATDTETVAMYANASKALPLDIIMNSFCTVLQPKITLMVSGKAYEKAVQLYRVFLELAFLTTGILCVGALAAAPQLMQLLYSAKYLNGLAIFCVYILVDLFRFTNITMIQTAAGRTKQLMAVGLGAVLGNVVLNFALYSSLGVIGPAVATLITTLLIGAVMQWMNAKVLNVRIVDFLDVPFLLRFLLEGAVVMLGCRWMRSVLTGLGVNYLLILLLTAGACCGMLLLCNFKRLRAAFRQINRLSC